MSYPIPRASIWPNVVYDTSSAKGMADAQAWQNEIIHDWLDMIQFGEVQKRYTAHRTGDPALRAGGWLRELRNGPVSPVGPRDGQIDTQTHVDTQTATQGASPNQSEWFFRASKVRAAEILNAAAEHAHAVSLMEPPTADMNTPTGKPVTHLDPPITQQRRDDRILYGDTERNLNA